MPSNLIDLLHARKSTKTPFGYGLCTADRYVKRVLAECPQAVSDGESMLKEACKIPTYSNEDMVLEKAMSVGSFKDLVPDGVVIPKNTLMVIRHVMTTTKEDRDHDILETGGAELDPRSPLLWQHIHTLPIGKLLAKIDHTKDMLRVVVALLDMNELTEDCAKLFEADALRFSHGFQVPQDGFEERKEQNGGFRIIKYSIFEDSCVSVPSNTDAVPDAIATQKFTSAIGKAFANSLLGERKTQVRGADVQELEKLAQKELFQETSPNGEWTVTTSFRTGVKSTDAVRPTIDNPAAIIEEDGMGSKAIDTDEKQESVEQEAVKEVAEAGNPKAESDLAIELEAAKSSIAQHVENNARLEVELKETKAGRVLSAANVKKLKDVRSDMEEIDGMLESRSGKALCKSCMEKLDSVIKAAEPKPESKPGDEDKPEPMADDEKPKSFDDVAAKLLMEGTPEQLARLQRAVEAIQYTAELDAKAKQYRAFTSAT